MFHKEENDDWGNLLLRYRFFYCKFKIHILIILFKPVMSASETVTLPGGFAINRVQSIDILRGFIMVIMALDHVRDFFHITAFTVDPLDPKLTSSAVFFTRWITHLCAPSFLLLSGISANLSGQRQTLSAKGSFLVKRGFWLVFVEIVFITLALSFDPAYKTIFLQVIWALGWSMIFLGILIRIFSSRTILIIGLILVFGHNMLDYLKLIPNSPLDIVLGVFLTSAGRFYPLSSGTTVAVLYAILPWTAIMLVGYGLGDLYKAGVSVKLRKTVLLRTGISAILLFIVLRYVNVYGDPSHWTVQATGWRTFLSFMNVSKYPPCLLYSLATLGPVLIMLSLADGCTLKLGNFFMVYGKVPFFYFVLHFYLIHTLCAITVLLSGYTWQQATDPSLFFKFRPFDFGFTIGWVYLVWIAIVGIMYFPSRWFGAFKARNKKWWLSYL
jgi:uncharacterized membrane protein